GEINGSEICDNGQSNGQYGFCNLDCTGQTPSVCGNQVKEGEEQCDDGNVVSGDGCSETCTTEIVASCGDGILQEGEQCDDGIEGSQTCTPNCEIIAPVCDPNQELIVNGDFEEPIVQNPSLWDIFDSSAAKWNIDWLSVAPVTYQDVTRPIFASLELQNGVNGWLAANGSQYAELDSDWQGPSGSLDGEPASVKIYQDIQTIPGYKYLVKFSFSARPDTAIGNNQLEFGWNNAFTDTLSATGGISNVWTNYEYTLTADTTTTKIQFSDLGTPDSLGTFLDNVSVRCIPNNLEPVCGNNIQEGNEECDGQAGITTGYTCSETCTLVPVNPGCQSGATQACTLEGVGVCAGGTQTCEAGQWSSCVANLASAETCDGLDNNCDGSVDEGLSCNSNPPGGGGGGGGGSGPIGLYIHNEKSDSGTDTVTALITWFTNKPATTRVVYDTVSHPELGIAPNYGYAWSTEVSDLDPKVTFHSVTITGLLPDTTYYFRPISAASPEILGKEITFATLAPQTVPEPEGIVAGVKIEAPEEPAQNPPTEEPTGVVAGSAFEEKLAQAPTDSLPAENAIPTPEPLPEVKPTDCSFWLWLLLIIDLVLSGIIWNQSKGTKNSWIKYLWLDSAILSLLPTIIWYPNCWLVGWLLVLLVMIAIYLALTWPKKTKQS
ncbi:MAG: hypothetical protein WCW26_04145, partial [Candidatus Buchananbacteria bacterium]